MPRLERSAGVIVFRRGAQSGIEYLLLDYGRHWEFPKGHVEPGEDDLAAALRELREETGIDDVRGFPDFRHEITYRFRDKKKGVIRKTVVFFLAETTATHVTISHEHEGFEFLRFDDAVKRVTFANARKLLRLANDRVVGPTPIPCEDNPSAPPPPAPVPSVEGRLRAN